VGLGRWCAVWGGGSGGVFLEEEVLLFLGDGEAEVFEDGEHVLPELAFFGGGLIAEEVGWVEGGHEGYAAVGLPVAAEAGDALGFAEESLHGGGAEGDHDLGLEEVDLLVQPGAAGGHFGGGGFAVAGGLARGVGAALEDVGDEDLAAAEPHGRDDLGEQLAGPAYKRLPLGILIRPRSLADEHDPGMDVAHPEHDGFAGGDEVGTLRAGDYPGPEIGDSRFTGAMIE